MASVTPTDGLMIPRVAEKMMVLPARDTPSKSKVAVNVRLSPEVTVKFSGARIGCVDRLS
ncbi:MAG: hypothetical protein QXH02_04715 [Desulfurococcaceae archaeon]